MQPKVYLSSLLMVIINCTFVLANNWCNINCHSQKSPHILCHYNSRDVSSACGTVVQAGLTNEDVYKILNVHNSYRQTVATGQERRGRPGPQPRAKHMPNMVWDNQLADIAQAWANQCNYGHRCAHLSSSFSDQIGQNLGRSWITLLKDHFINKNAQIPYEQFVHDWYNEVNNFNKNIVTNYRQDNSVSHYTQIVWAKTTKVGCGGMKFIKDGQFTAYLVCNYGPGGNYPGEALYETD